MNIIERLKELQAAATPGPWVVGGSYTVRTMRSSLDWIARVRDRHHSHADSEDAANAKLIVALHNVLPDLIEVVEAAREWHKTKMVLRESDVDTNAQAATDYYVASDGLSAALAKLEGGRSDED